MGFGADLEIAGLGVGNENPPGREFEAVVMFRLAHLAGASGAGRNEKRRARQEASWNDRRNTEPPSTLG